MIRSIQLFISKFWLKTSFIILGLGSLAWFLIRVIPKPSRAQYPCMKAATPLASSFIAYLLGLTTFTFLLRKTKQNLQKSKFFLAAVFIIMGLIAGVWTIVHTNATIKAAGLQPLQAGNEPIGNAKGTIPGRVVWVHEPDATNENCTNVSGSYWYTNSNTNQTVVNSMVSTGIKSMTGASSDAAAWDSIFKYYNRTHGKGNVGYKAGEKFAIKINLNGGDGNPNINTSPQVCLAILSQLINVAGVAQADIGIGDPLSSLHEVTWTVCHSVFPNVKYWGTLSGRTPIQQSATKVLKLSDGSADDYLPKQYVDAAYMINIPVFKKHHRAGISLCSKNHFGSIGAFTGGAWHLHPSLPSPGATGEAANGEYGVYRCFVDIIGHKDLGGKTILFLIDGLWGSVNYAHPPVKWEMTPFNNDWPSSLFLSQDPVAIESVGYDFLYNEFDEDHPTEGIDVMSDNAGPFPHFQGTDDFLHQAADTANWPDTIQYDPEGDGTILTSMGTHEHWNNPTDKEYTRNLGTGNGIELVYIYGVTGIEGKISEGFKHFYNYPNPFIGSTSIRFSIELPSEVALKIISTNGQLVKAINFDQKISGNQEYIWDATDNGGSPVAAGNYICTIEFKNSEGISRMSEKMLLIK